MKRFTLFALGLLFFTVLKANSTSPNHIVTIHFKYGSRPAKGNSKTEEKWFGGIHGGHVLLQVDSELFSFYPNGERFHWLAHKNQKHGEYVGEPLKDWVGDTATCKFASIEFPITNGQYYQLRCIKEKYMRTSPYDYAFFGMRCASAAYDVLGQIGVVKKLGGFANVCINFYPQPLRQRLLRYALKNHLKVIKHGGRSTRVWEKDFVKGF